jgi:pyruvate dehydrogenase E1 component alpha subunit
MVQERTLPSFQAETASLTPEEGLILYEDMVLGRLFEDKCAEMYYRGKMFGFVHLYNGQEGVSSGIIKALDAERDYVCSTYRDHVHALSAGVPAREVMAELFGKETGCSKGRGDQCTCSLQNIAYWEDLPLWLKVFRWRQERRFKPNIAKKSWEMIALKK